MPSVDRGLHVFPRDKLAAAAPFFFRLAEGGCTPDEEYQLLRQILYKLCRPWPARGLEGIASPQEIIDTMLDLETGRPKTAVGIIRHFERRCWVYESLQFYEAKATGKKIEYFLPEA